VFCCAEMNPASQQRAHCSCKEGWSIGPQGVGGFEGGAALDTFGRSAATALAQPRCPSSHGALAGMDAVKPATLASTRRFLSTWSTSAGSWTRWVALSADDSWMALDWYKENESP
jgi:hypothetical protein